MTTRAYTWAAFKNRNRTMLINDSIRAAIHDAESLANNAMIEAGSQLYSLDVTTPDRLRNLAESIKEYGELLIKCGDNILSNISE